MKIKRILTICCLSLLFVSCGGPLNVTSTSDELGSGFGKRSKKENSFAISKVTTEENDLVTYDNIYEYLAGRVPGLSVEGNTITIRGAASMSSTPPLIIVDGIETSLDVINPHDIADVTVLKDGSAAQYGSRAVGGVIVIETKK